jgi:hypothetical protein
MEIVIKIEAKDELCGQCRYQSDNQDASWDQVV